MGAGGKTDPSQVKVANMEQLAGCKLGAHIKKRMKRKNASYRGVKVVFSTEVQQPHSLKVCAMLHKPEATEYPITIDYLGFTVPNKFLLGYGLDFDGLGRNLPEIYQLVEE